MGPVYFEEKYQLLLQVAPAEVAEGVARRYVSFFVIDSFGKSQLLFPLIAATSRIAFACSAGESTRAVSSIGQTVHDQNARRADTYVFRRRSKHRLRLIGWERRVRTRWTRGEYALEKPWTATSAGRCSGRSGAHDVVD
jgi:hypothetical protein